MISKGIFIVLTEFRLRSHLISRGSCYLVLDTNLSPLTRSPGAYCILCSECIFHGGYIDNDFDEHLVDSSTLQSEELGG